MASQQQWLKQPPLVVVTRIARENDAIRSTAEFFKLVLSNAEPEKLIVW